MICNWKEHLVIKQPQSQDFWQRSQKNNHELSKNQGPLKERRGISRYSSYKMKQWIQQQWMFTPLLKKKNVEACIKFVAENLNKVINY